MDILFFKINAGRRARDDFNGRLGKLAHLPCRIQRVEQDRIIILGNRPKLKRYFLSFQRGSFSFFKGAV